MDPHLHAHLAAHQRRLDALVARGRDLSVQLAADPANAAAFAAMRAWQSDCAVTINELSGGTKAHWLARAYSDAFLVRSVTGAAPSDIASRIVAVLERASASLSQLGETEHDASASAHESARFGFVHHEALRPVLEQAYKDSRRAFDQRDYGLALMTASGIVEAILTDALEHKGFPPGEISRWSFDERITAAQAAGLIRGGAARLPAAARHYRVAPDAHVTERDARVTSQVLNVLMRDLDPGR